MPLPVTPRLLPAGLFASVAIGGALLSCTEPHIPTAPRAVPRAPAHLAVSFSGSIPIDESTGSGQTTLPDLGAGQLVEIRISGTVTASPRTPPGQSYTVGPNGFGWQSGTGIQCGLRATVTYANTSVAPPFCDNSTAPLVDTVWAQGAGTATRTGPIDTPNFCSISCFQYSGSQSVSVQSVTSPKLMLKADKMLVHPDSFVKYDAYLDSPGISQSRWTITKWDWTPDSAGAAPYWSESKRDTTHTGPMRWPGTTRVFATVDGRADTAVIHIATIEPPQMQLYTSKVGAAPNSNVDYLMYLSSGDSAAWGPQFQAVGWRFLSDDGTQVWSGGYGSFAISGAISKTGRMFADGKIAGRKRTTQRRIRVIQCPVNDSLLDNQSVRDSLKALWGLSNPNDPNTANRREQVASIYRDPNTGEIFVKPWANPANTPCKSSLPGAALAGPPPPEWMIGQAHTHPFKDQDSLPVACWDHGRPTRYDALRFGGPSSGDWGNVYNARFGSNVDLSGPEYVLDAVNVYHADPSIAPVDQRTRTPRFPRRTSGTCSAGQILL